MKIGFLLATSWAMLSMASAQTTGAPAGAVQPYTCYTGTPPYVTVQAASADEAVRLFKPRDTRPPGSQTALPAGCMPSSMYDKAMANVAARVSPKAPGERRQSCIREADAVHMLGGIAPSGFRTFVAACGSHGSQVITYSYK